MAKSINFCEKDKKYTMQEKCPICNQKVHEKKSAKFSLDDNYAHLKRKAKREEYRQQGLL